MQEDGATSSTDVAEPSADYTEIYNKVNESVSVEQGQLLRAVEADQSVLKVKTQRQRVILEFTHSLLSPWCPACVCGKTADDLHRRRQDSDLEDASFDRTNIAAGARMDKVLVNHNNGAVAVTGPTEVTEHTVRVKFEMWRMVCGASVKMRQQRPHC